MPDDLELPLPLDAVVEEPLNAQRDDAVEAAVATLRAADPTGVRAGRVFRATFDQLYDGQHTGRYKWDQLFKTEKTHYGTLIEINLRREFQDVFSDGHLLDYQINGHEIDCKYSMRMGGWMLPPESFDQLLLVCTANDQNSEWAMGVVRATEANRKTSVNRDGKTTLSEAGRAAIDWVRWAGELPPNVLLQIPPEDQAAIFGLPSGQQRLNELFRRTVRRRIGRNTVATVAQQDDYMKRVRSNGGSRSTLALEGYLIPGGDYESHRQVARGLGIEVPDSGEFVSVRVRLADDGDPNSVLLDGQLWRAASDDEGTTTPAPSLPTTRRAAAPSEHAQDA